VRLVLATRNPHKVREFEALLAPHEIVALPDDVELPPETADTFSGNALGKARAAATATGLPAIAEAPARGAGGIGARLRLRAGLHRRGG
jgi:XTP/dITP diphosphohydrolase